MRQRISELEADVAARTAAAGGGGRSGTPADGGAAAAAPSEQAADPAERCWQLEASLARAEAALQQRASEAAAESSSFQQREAALASGNQSAQVLPVLAASESCGIPRLWRPLTFVCSRTKSEGHTGAQSETIDGSDGSNSYSHRRASCAPGACRGWAHV